METKHQKIKQLADLVCNFYRFDIVKFENTKNRTMPLPKIRHVVCYLAKQNFSISYKELANYFDKKTHSTIYTTVKNIKERMQFDKALKKEINEIERYLIDNGLSKKSNFQNEFFDFFDLNNCIAVSKNNQKILFSNFEMEEVNSLISGNCVFLPDELKQYQNTKTFVYKPKTNKYE